MAEGQVEVQLGLEEEVIQDEQLEDALEQRQAARARYLELRAGYRELDAMVKGHIARAVPEAVTVARVGRFRLERKQLEGGKHVEFDTQPSERVLIKVDGDD